MTGTIRIHPSGHRPEAPPAAGAPGAGRRPRGRTGAAVRFAALALAAWVAAACDQEFLDDDLVGAAPGQVAVVSGNNQSGAVGSPFRQALRVQVRDERGNPLARTRVEFGASIGDGLLSALSGVTDFAGFTEVRFTPLTPGDLVVTAQQAGGGAAARASFALFAIDSSGVRNPATFDIVGGNNQTGTVGTILPQPLAVRVENADGNPIEGFPVVFTATSDGTLLLTVNDGDFTQVDSLGGTPETPDSIGTQVVSFSDPNGVAAVLMRLRTRPGNNQVTASATFATGSSNSVTFNATGSTGGSSSAAQVLKISGDTQTVTVDTTGIGFTPSITFNPMVVQVSDRFGNPISGVTVFFRVSTGFGSLSAASDVTDANGFAETTYTSTAGSFGGIAVSATVPTAGSVVFTGGITPVGETPEEEGGGGGGGAGG
jgi:adhesin/invasin